MAESSLGSILHADFRLLLIVVVVVVVVVINSTAIISLGVILGFNGFRERAGFGIQKGRHEIEAKAKGSQFRWFSETGDSRKNGRLDKNLND